MLAQHPRGPHRGRDGPQAQAHRAARHAEPQQPGLGGPRGAREVRQARQAARLARTVLQGRRTGGNTRGDIGTKPTKAPPSELDFNIWLGPAQEQPYHENLVHYRWHWFWDFGNGDIGNQGVHEMDKARWVIPGATWPKSVISFGGRYANNDQGQTPNTLVTIFDYGETLLIFETRGLKSPAFRAQSVGNILHFEEGVVARESSIRRARATAKRCRRSSGAEKIGGDHFANFIDCVRSRDLTKLHADIEVGHVSAGLCHLGNISYRLGKETDYDPKLGKLSGNEFGNRRAGPHGRPPEGQRHQVRRQEPPRRQKLDFDGKTEHFVNDDEANALLTRKYRCAVHGSGQGVVISLEVASSQREDTHAAAQRTTHTEDSVLHRCRLCDLCASWWSLRD